MFEKREKIILSVDNRDDSANLDFNFDNQENWHQEEEGKLSVDVLENENEIIVLAPMAGTEVSGLELHLQNDLLTIKGERIMPDYLGSTFVYEECYWGKFSRTVVLPKEVKSELVRAEYKNGLLVITVPKFKEDRKIPIYIVDD